MSDSEIGEKLNINRSTSYRHRRNSLEEIRKQLKEKKTNEEYIDTAKSEVQRLIA